MTTPLLTVIRPSVIRTCDGQLEVDELLPVALADPLAVAEVLAAAWPGEPEADGDAAATARWEPAASSKPAASRAADRYRGAGLVSII